jgi:hypothetical protein
MDTVFSLVIDRGVEGRRIHRNYRNEIVLEQFNIPPFLSERYHCVSVEFGSGLVIA